MVTKKERSNTIMIARHLCYPKEVIERLRKAKTESELCRIMITARQTEIERDK